MNHTIFKRSVTALVIVAMVVNPALAQQPSPELVKQQELQSRYGSANKIAAAPVPTAVISSVQVDLAAEQARQAGIKQASNGTTVVDISAPTAAGVSHNLFSEFNVDSNGLILNNSVAPILTQLGGWTDGNRRLTGGEASIILNEVTGLSRSNLLGHIEIAGQSAEFVLANVNGISCDGCGFINTPRVTLVTGRPDIANGALNGFTVSGGDFSLDGRGLNATNIDQFDILTRAAKINAELYAKQLNVVTGNNYIEYASGAASVNGTGVAPAFQFALDASSVGAMYANSIRFIGTEQGMGVNSEGLIQSVTDLELSADGNISVKHAQANNNLAMVSQSGDITTTGNIYASNLTLTAKNKIDNQGLLAASEKIHLSGTDFSQTGNLYAGLNADASLSDTGALQATFANSFSTAGTVYVGGDFSLDAVDILNDQGQFILQSADSLIAAGDLVNRGLIQFNSNNAALQATNIDNSAGTARLAVPGSMTINASETFTNDQGVISVSDQLSVTAETLNNTAGVLAANTISLDAITVKNNQGHLQAEQLSIHAQDLQNQQGVLNATGIENNSLSIVVEGAIDNTAGGIYTKADTQLTARHIINTQGVITAANKSRLDLQVTDDFDNDRGIVQASHLQLDATNMSNHAGTMIAGLLDLDIGNLLSNNGHLQADTVRIGAQQYQSKGGVLLAQGRGDQSLVINVKDSIQNNQGAIIESHGGDLQIASRRVDNNNGQINLLGTGLLSIDTDSFANQQGALAANGSIVLTAADVENNGGSIQARELTANVDQLDNNQGLLVAEKIQLTGNTLNNNSGNIAAQQTLALDVNTLINRDGSVSSGAQYLSLNMQTLDNKDGQITHSGNGLFSLTLNQLLNAGGTIATNGSLGITAASANNNSGELNAAGYITLNAGQWDNQNGVAAAGGAFVANAGAVNNRFGHIQGSSLQLNAQSLNNSQGALLNTAGGASTMALSIAGDLNNQQGLISAQGNLTLEAQTLNNNAGVVDAQDLNLVVERITNVSGLLQGSQINLTIPELDNTDGTINARSASGAGLRLNVSGLLNNTRGNLIGNGTGFVISANHLLNNNGNIEYYGSGWSMLNAVRLDNSKGNIYSSSNLNIKTDKLINIDGAAIAQQDVEIFSTTLLDNTNGQLMAGANQTISTKQLLNEDGVVNANNLVIDSVTIDNLNAGVIEANGLTLKADTLNNEGKVFAAAAADEDLVFDVKKFNNAGRLEAHSEDLLLNNLELTSTGGEIIHQGTGTLHILSDGTFNNQQGIIASQGTIKLDADAIDNRTGKLIAKKDLLVDLTALNNEAGIIQSGNGLSLTLDNFNNSNGGQLIMLGSAPSNLAITGELNNRSGSIVYWGDNLLSLMADILDNSNTGTIGGSGAINLVARQLNNNAGNLLGDSHINIQTDTLDNDQGTIESSILAIDANQLNNNGVILATDTDSDSLTIEANSFINSGIIESYGTNLTLTNTNLNNTSGIIAHRGSGVLAITQDQLVNQQGTIVGNNNVHLWLNDLDNTDSGEIVAGNNLQLDVARITNSNSLLQAAQSLQVNADQLDNLGSGKILALGDSALTIDSDSINNQSVIAANRDLVIHSNSLNNHATGLIQSVAQLDVVSLSLVNVGFIDASDLYITAQTLDNQAGAQIQAGSVEFSGGNWNNAGILFAHDSTKNSTITLDELRNNGLLESHNNSVNIAAQLLDNKNGELIHQGAGSLALHINDLQNQNGLIAADTLAINSTALDNSTGELVADVLTIDTQTLNNQTGLVQADNSLVLNATQLDNRAAGLVLASGTGTSILNVEQLDNRAGTLALNNLNINAQHFDNREGELIADNLAVIANSLNNNEGVIATTEQGSDDNLQLTVMGTLTNNQGLIQGGGKNSLINADILTNDGGDIIHTGAGVLTINAANINNTQGGDIHSNNDLALGVTGHLENNASVISATDTANVNADTIANKGGTLIAGDYLAIQATTLTNSSPAANLVGLISSNWLKLTIDTLNNQTGSRINAEEIELDIEQFNNHGLLLATDTGGESLKANVQQLHNTGRIESAGENLVLNNVQINNTGEIVHRGSGQLQIAQGNLVNNQGVIDAAGTINIDAASVSNRDGVIVARAPAGIILTADELDNSAGLLTADNLQLNSLSINNTQGEISGALIAIDAEQINNAGGIITAVDLSIKAQELTNAYINSLAGVIDAKNLTLTVSELNNQALIQAEQLNLHGEKFNNNQGVLLATASSGSSLQMDFVQGISNSQGTIESHSDQLTISSKLDNRDGLVLLTGNGDLTLANVNNSNGQVLSNGNVTVTSAAEVANENGLIQALANVSIHSGDLNNNTGTIAAGKALTIASTDLNNRQGLLVADGTADNSLQLNVTNAIDNTQGVIETRANNFSLDNPTIINTQGEIRHLGAGTFAVNAANDFTNTEGLLYSQGTLAMNVNGTFTNQGNLVAVNQLTVNATRVANELGGLMDANTTTVTGEQISNRGRIQGDVLSLNGNQLDNKTGELLALGTADNSLVLNMLEVDNSSNGLIESHSNHLTLATAINNQGGTLLNLGLGTLTLADLLNTNGNVYAAGNLSLVQSSLNNQGGYLEAAGDIQFQLTDMDNRAGYVRAGKNLQLNAASLDNSQSGRVLGVDGFSLNVTGELNNEQGQLASLAQDMDINSAELNNSLGQIIHQGSGQLNVSSGNVLDNRGGQISTEGTLSLTMDTILNNVRAGHAALVKANDLSIIADNLQNNGGHIQAGQYLSLTLPTLDNEGGNILSLGTAANAFELSVNTFNNRSGVLEVHSNNLDLSSVVLNNQDGIINHQGTGALRIVNQHILQNAGGTLQSRGAIQLDVAAINNKGGLINADQLNLTATNQIDNSQAGTLAGNQLVLSGGTINNNAGLIAALGNNANALTFNTQNIIDNSLGVIRNGATNWSLQLEKINNTGGSVVHQGTGTFTLTSNGNLTNTGTIASIANLHVNAAGIDNQGNLVADNNLILNSTGQITNAASGVIKGASALTVDATQLSNQGEIVSGSALALDIDGQLNNSGVLVTNANSATITAATVNNNGTIAHNGSGSLALSAATINNATGVLKSAATLALNASTISNNNIISAGSMSASGFNNFTNNGHLEASNTYLSGNSLNNYGTFNASGNSTSLLVNNLLNAGNFYSGSYNQSFSGSFTNSGQFVHTGTGVLSLGNAGAVTLSGGNVSTAGTASLSGSISGSGSLFAKSGISIGGNGTFNNNGSSLYTQGGLTINSAVNNIGGSLIADGRFMVNTTGNINNTNGWMQGQQIDFTANVLTNIGGTIVSTGNGSASITAAVIDNHSGGKIAATNDTFSVVTTAGDLNNQSGSITKSGAGSLVLTSAGDLNNHSGTINSQGRLVINTAESIFNINGNIVGDSLAVGTAGMGGLDNSGGQLVATGTADSNLQFMTGIKNAGGLIAANSHNLSIHTPGTINNSSGTIGHFGAGLLSADYSSFENNGGAVRSNGAIDWSTAGHFTNTGEISAFKNLTINANSITNSGILGSRAAMVDLDVGTSTVTNNTGGHISGAQKVDIAAQYLTNNGTLQSDDTIALTLKSLGAIGNVSAGNLLDLNITDSINIAAAEKITSSGNLRITTEGNIANAGSLSSEKVLTLNAAYLSNSGTISGGSGGESQINVTTAIANNGRISSSDDLKITANQYWNYGTTATGNDLTINTTAEITNLANMVIFSGGNMNLGVSALNNNGTIFSIGDMDIAAVNYIRNEQARIESLGNMSLSANYIRNIGATPIETITTSPRTEEYLYSSPNSDCNKPNEWSWGCRVFSFSESTHYDYTTSGAEAVIASGGNLSLNGNNTISNLYGVISTGANLTVSGGLWDMASVRDKTRTRTGTVVYVGLGPCSHCVENPNEKGSTTVTTPDANSTPIGIVRAVGNISGSLAGSITNSYGHASGNQSADYSTTGGDGTPGNRGSQANSASGNGGNVVTQNGTAGNTNNQSHAYGGQVNGSNVNAGGVGNNPIGSANNLDLATANGSVGNGNSYSASTEQQVSTNNSGVLIDTQTGGTGSTIGQSNVGLAGANNRDDSIVSGVIEDIQALKDQAFAALFGGTATSTTISTDTPEDNASDIDEQDSNLAALDGLTPDTAVFDETSKLHELDTSDSNSTGVNVGSNTRATGGASGPTAVGSVKGSATGVTANGNAPETTVIEVLPGDFNPKNVGGLYVENKTPNSNVLIETRPEFTEYSNFLGSDYLLDAIGYNPDKTIKRLGDAFFENQLIRDALVRQTNTRFVGDATNDYDQMQTLMNNAVAANQSLQLSVGVALTKDQAAALTSDIVWLVEKTVNGEKVLVPELYLASVDKATLLPSGAVMSAGGKIDLWSGNGISTQGTIASGGLLSLGTLGNFNQNGTISSNTGVMLTAGQDFTNRGQVNGPLVSVFAGGDITNLSNISATNFLGLTGDSITNTASGKLQSNGWLNLTAQNDIRNQQGLIEGVDVNLVSREGSIINRTEFTTFTSADGRSTSTSLGAASTILSHNSLRMDAGKDLDLQGSQFKAAQDITLKAGNDILLGAIELASSRDTSTRKVTTKTSSVEHQVVSIEAGHQLTLDAGRDLNAEGTQFKAGVDANLKAGRDLNLNALANTTHSESIAKRKKVIDTETTHTLVDIQSGGNVSLKAGQDANLTGTNVNAEGNVNLAAERDVNLTAVVDSDYHYDYTKKKKSFGRSKTTENETLDQTVTGGVINAGGNILVNSHVDSTGKLVTDESGNVNLIGATLNAGGSAVVAADEDINITGMTYEELDFHRKKKSGVGGLSKKDKGAVEADTKLQNALIAAGGDAHFLSGNNLTLAATDVIVDGNVNLEAVDKLLVTAGEVVNNSERWSKKSGIGSGGNLYGSKEHKSGEGVTSTQESTITAGGQVTGRVGSGEIVGSDITGAGGVKLVSDMGDIDVTAGRTTVQSYSHDKEMSVGLGDLVEGMTRPDQLVKNKDGRATIKLADAQYDKVDTQTTTTEMRGSTITSNEDVSLIAAAGSVNIQGSDVTADADNSGTGTLGLAGATGVSVTEATETSETQTKEVHGSAELSFVVQHQAAEVVKAVIAVDEAKDKLEQAKKDYKAYERNVSQLEEQLTQLESDYANKVPGVNYDDLLELRELVGDVKGDKEWYQAGIALAAINLTSATTALVQQTAAAAQSASTYGFNAGIQLDIDASKSKTNEKSTTAVASNLSGNQVLIQTGTVGEDGKLNTQGTGTTISGSHITATDRISVQTGDLNLLASKNTSESQSEQEHGHITAQVTVYGASGGASITGSFDRSKESDRSTTYNNTTLTANNIDLTTSGDANIRGANVHANEHLDADIQGDLNLESVQNRSNSRNTSMGISGGVSFGGTGAKKDSTQGLSDVGGMSGVNGGINAGNGMSVTRETVLTSLTSGGTADVNVKGNTQITGALLATINEDGSDRNQLDFSTGSLNFTDLRNNHQNTQTNAGVSANFGVGEGKTENSREGQPTAEGANGKTLYANTSNLTYSNTQENSASKTLATLGHGNITVGGTQLEKDGELTDAGKANGSPLIGMNRDTANTEKELWNSEQSQTVDATLDHRLLTSDGRQQIKNDATDTKEFGQDIGRAVGTVRQEEALGVTDFWRTLDNNTKATQLKNELTRNPAYKELMEGLKSQDGDTFAQSFAALGQMAQVKFGISPDQFSEIFLYRGNNTTSTSLGSTLFTDTKGGTVLDKNNAQFGNIFINADGSVKTDMLNTLGHETVEAFSLLTGGKNDAAQEAQANAFGTQFSDRINQAAGSDLDSTGGSTFNASLNNSYAVTQGTIKANTVGNAEVDNRKLNSQFAMGLPNYIAGKKAQGDLQGAQAAEVLLILGALAEKRGPTDNLNAEIDQLDAGALGVSPESLEAAKLLPDTVKKRIVTAEPSDFCKGTACTVTAEVADSMLNPADMTDLAVEYVGGALIGAGVDAYKAIKAGGKAADEVATTANAAGDNLVGVRAEGDFGKLPPNQKYYEMQTTSGVVIKATEGKTTTVLGTYAGDTQNIINDQLILAKNADYTAANNGGFNILNAPDGMYKTPDQFWVEVNEPFLKAAVERGDEIYMATKPIDDVLNRKLPDDSLQRSGFGKEYDFLIKHGYRYDEKTGKMIKIN